MLTLCKVITGREAYGLQFTVCDELDVQVPPTGADVCRAFLPAVATNEGGEAKGSIANLNVIELALPGRFYGIFVVEEQVDALARRGWGSRWDTEMLRRSRRGEEQTKVFGHKASPSIM